MTQFAKGQSGNPGGKAKKKIRATINGVEGDYTELEIFAPAMTKAAKVFLDTLEDDKAPLDAKLRAAEFVTNRVFGKARQAVELTGDDGDPIALATSVDLTGLTEEQLRALASIPIPAE